MIVAKQLEGIHTSEEHENYVRGTLHDLHVNAALKLKLKLGDITIQLKQPKPAYTVELNPRCIQLEEHEQVNADTAGERLSLR